MIEDFLIGVNINKRPMNEVLVDLNNLGFELKDTLQHIHYFFGALDTKQLNQAKQIKGVYIIEFNKVTGVRDEE